MVERERRFIVAGAPEGVFASRAISDRYVIGTRLRLREVREAEWALLATLPARVLHKTRHTVRDGLSVAVDEHEDGTLVAELEAGDGPRRPVPAWLEVVEDVTDDERWTGASLAR